jgi:cyclopropane fatty-acyl-phospholipid synthase-like methyltransferase
VTDSGSLPYDALGIIYDALGHHDYTAWGAYLAGLLKDKGVKPGGKLIDAACGTGGITLELAKAGYSVLGMDISQQMLTAAAAKSTKAGALITFVRQDIRAMRVHRPVDGIICSCDGVNYLLTTQDLTSFLTNARKSLSAGGVLLFDISSEEKLMAMDGQLYGEETSDSAYLWTNSVSSRTKVITMDITLFIKQLDYYRREHEVHRQRIWSTGEIEEALQKCGYQLNSMYGAFTREPPQAGCDRIQFVATAN